MWRRRVLPTITIAAPWLWFAIRDTTPAMELVAVTLPLLAAAYATAPTSYRQRFQHADGA